MLALRCQHPNDLLRACSYTPANCTADASGHQQVGDVQRFTHSKQGRARRQRARAANKGKGVAHIGADAWLAEDQYTHVAEEQHEQLGPVLEQRRGIDVYGPAEAHAGQGRVCRPVACSGV